jgi:hypothetical protein
MRMTKTFTTLDLYLSAFLSLHNLEPTLEVKNGKVIFVFSATDELYRLMGMFNGNQDTPCLDLITATKTLRGKMLSAKQSIADNENGRNYGTYNR